MSEEREGGGTGACCQVSESAVCTDGAGGGGPVHRDTAPPTDSHERQLSGTEGQVTGEWEREREEWMTTLYGFSRCWVKCLEYGVCWGNWKTEYTDWKKHVKYWSLKHW